MRPYEVMIIFDAGLEEENVRAVLDRATETLTARGGTIVRVDRWGRRRFAYELKHRLEGYYVLIEANAEPAAMAEMDRVLSLADEVLRHKVVRIADRPAGRAPRPTAASEASEPPVAAPAEPTGV